MHLGKNKFLHVKYIVASDQTIFATKLKEDIYMYIPRTSCQFYFRDMSIVELNIHNVSVHKQIRSQRKTLHSDLPVIFRNTSRPEMYVICAITNVHQYKMPGIKCLHDKTELMTRENR